MFGLLTGANPHQRERERERGGGEGERERVGRMREEPDRDRVRIGGHVAIKRTPQLYRNKTNGNGPPNSASALLLIIRVLVCNVEVSQLVHTAHPQHTCVRSPNMMQTQASHSCASASCFLCSAQAGGHVPHTLVAGNTIWL